MTVTLRDIAKQAQVSMTTASLILNDKGNRFAWSTRNRVIKIAKEHNYTPNRAAASLTTGQTRTLGVIVPDIRNPFFSALAHGIDTRATELGWSIYLSNSSDSHLKEIQIISIMLAQQVDGILFCMAGNTDETLFWSCYKRLEEAQIPFLLVDRYYEIPDMEKVITLDHRSGGYLATRHLIELGHTQIACITGPLNLIDACSRLEGYKEALRQAGLPFNPLLVLEGDYHQNTGYRLASTLLESQVKVEAFFACNDLMALGIIEAVEEAGLTMPEDISVVGYDDVLSNYFKNIPLTSVRQPVDNLGRSAAERIIERMGVSVEKTSFVLDPTLSIRKSTAPPTK